MVASTSSSAPGRSVGPGRRFALSSYRALGRSAARVLLDHPLVESVYARRGLAAGDISFGRSDIDLTLVVRRLEPASEEGKATWGLLRRVRRLRRLLPVVGECELATEDEIRNWYATESYRGSIDTRSRLLLAGAPLKLEPPPVRREDAVRRVVFWLDRFFATAVRERNQRNLTKIALEIWTATLTARGDISEPLLTKQEMLEAYLADPPPDLPGSIPGEAEKTIALCLELVARQRPRATALEKLQSPLMFEAPLPPRYERRTVVVLPEPGSALPPEADRPDSFVCTPESLEAFVWGAFPFAYWALPESVRALGISEPDPASFLRACTYFGHPYCLRLQGFARTTSQANVMATALDALAQLERGEPPTPPRGQELERFLTPRQASERDFYLNIFPGLYRRSRRAFIDGERAASGRR
jgi:predicted nucleotidyltransferase